MRAPSLQGGAKIGRQPLHLGERGIAFDGIGAERDYPDVSWHIAKGRDSTVHCGAVGGAGGIVHFEGDAKQRAVLGYRDIGEGEGERETVSLGSGSGIGPERFLLAFAGSVKGDRLGVLASRSHSLSVAAIAAEAASAQHVATARQGQDELADRLLCAALHASASCIGNCSFGSASSCFFRGEDVFWHVRRISV